MRKIYFLAMALFATFAVSAQSSTVIDLSTIDAAFTTDFEGETVLDVGTTSAHIDSVVCSIDNPFYGNLSADEFEISFDHYNYEGLDSIKVLGALFSFYDMSIGRLYFTNGSYLGANVGGIFYDANLKNYGIYDDLLGGEVWKSVRLRFSKTGYECYIDDVLKFDETFATSNTDTAFVDEMVDNHALQLQLMGACEKFNFGAGSWWSDNRRTDGTFWDKQFSYLKNIKFTVNPFGVGIADEATATNAEVLRVEFFNIAGQKVNSDFNALVPGIYIKRTIYTDGTVEGSKLYKMNK